MRKRPVIAVKGNKIKHFRSLTHAGYFLGLTAGGMRVLMYSNNRERNGWKFNFKENINNGKG